MIEGVLFDVDGLLVDSEPCWTAARRQLAAETGQDWTDDDKRACMGVSTREWSGYMIRRLGLGLSPGEVEARIIGFIKAEYARAIPFLPGAIEAVRLASLHFRVGIASGSHRDLVDAVAEEFEPLVVRARRRGDGGMRDRAQEKLGPAEVVDGWIRNRWPSAG